MAQTQTASTAYALETHNELPAELRTKAKRGGRGGASQYPFDKMEVNQSFFVPVDANKDEGKAENTLQRLQSSISAARTKLNFDHNNLVEREVKIRGGNGKTEMRKVPSPLPEDKQRDFRARVEDHKGTKGVRIYRVK